MSLRFTFFIIITISAIFLTACPSPDNPLNTNAGNTNLPNANKVVVNSNSPFNTVPKPVTETTNNAPTLAPVVAAYYEALKKKDDAGIRKVLSAEFIKMLEADMKDEGKTSLAAYITEIDKVPEKPVEVRNEKIEGDKATAELKGGMNINWTAYTFRKESGAWKMTNDFTDVQSVNQSNSNTAANKAK